MGGIGKAVDGGREMTGVASFSLDLSFVQADAHAISSATKINRRAGSFDFIGIECGDKLKRVFYYSGTHIPVWGGWR
jgi:hypothetical protein